jgi:hypothetical protein
MKKKFMNDDEKSLVVHCATNDGDQLSKFHNWVLKTFDNF